MEIRSGIMTCPSRRPAPFYQILAREPPTSIQRAMEATAHTPAARASTVLIPANELEAWN